MSQNFWVFSVLGWAVSELQGSSDLSLSLSLSLQCPGPGSAGHGVQQARVSAVATTIVSLPSGQ